MDAFITKITGFFDKDMLFASFLPGLLFLGAVSGALLHIIGFDAAFELYDTLSDSSVIVIGVGALVGLIAFSYILYSVRDTLLTFWSGNSFLFYFNKLRHERLFRELRKESMAAGVWPGQSMGFMKKILEDYFDREEIPVEEEDEFIDLIDKLSVMDTEQSIAEFFSKLKALQQKYLSRSLDKIHRQLFTRILSWSEPAVHENIRKLREGYSILKPFPAPAPEQAVDEATKMCLLEHLWRFEHNVENASPDSFYADFGKARESFRPGSLQFVSIKLLDLIYKLDKDSEKQTRYGLWTGYLKEIVAEPVVPEAVLSDEEEKKEKEEKEKEKKRWEEKEEEAIKKIDEFVRKSDREAIKVFLGYLNDLFKSWRRELLGNVLKKIRDLDDEMKADHHRLMTALDRKYGSLGTIKGTRLGNIVQSYNEYPFKRYKIESEVFWPRLQKVIGPEYKDLITDHKIRLDFYITGISLASVFLVFCMVGPWLYSSVPFWTTLFILSLLIIILGYNMGVSSAESLGHIVRSSYDLHRLELLKSLGLEFPGNTSKERDLWEGFSRIVVYGEPGEALVLNEKKP